MNPASFRKDYSELVPLNQDFYQNIFKLNGRSFLFEGTNDGVQGYGTFNLKIQDREYGLSSELSPIELSLWSFEIEERTIVCAVAQHFRRLSNSPPDANMRFRYTVEAINVSCLHHRADAAITKADCQMLSRILRKMLPDYHRMAFRNFPLQAAAPIEIVERWSNPNRQVASFLALTTQVAWDVDSAERQVEGIDSFFKEGWRDRYDFGSDNNFAVKFRAPPIEDIPSFSFIFDGLEFTYNYQEVSEKLGQKSFFSALVYAPWSPNSLRASVDGAPMSSIADETRARADRFARFRVYKKLRASRGEKYRETPLSVILLSGAL
ncbi:hypothetical protein [Rhizobium ruizarguesonis]|uniref:hypothetical protein n=1 Tax=Rhizobium ruizarguesonis TaxID=2081791 RepID=UPI001031FB75|nr:hypothetical protein [Rhizobium ruizarguesonis]NKQ88462.1 hypothetical protein [Rhizobium ruizarguesonis]TBA80361.1 hypothetical protein ELH56_08990 [Rhizobium ruizarguesonis]